MKHTDLSRRYHNMEASALACPEFKPKNNIEGISFFTCPKSNFSCGYMQVNISINRNIEFTKENYNELIRLCKTHRKPILFTASTNTTLAQAINKFVNEQRPKHLKKLTSTESGHGKYDVDLYMIDIPELV